MQYELRQIKVSLLMLMRKQRPLEWSLFDKGHSDKLLSTDAYGDGVLDTDVLIKGTPWTGGPKTEEEYQHLVELAEEVFIPHGEVTIAYKGEKMQTELIVDREQICRIATDYCIPVKRIAQVRKKTCGGGYSTYEVLTAKGKGWQGCGHAMCSQCKYGSAEGVVGDDAIEAYMEDWLDKFFAGESMPDYVRRCLTSDTWAEHYRSVRPLTGGINKVFWSV